MHLLVSERKSGRGVVSANRLSCSWRPGATAWLWTEKGVTWLAWNAVCGHSSPAADEVCEVWRTEASVTRRERGPEVLSFASDVSSNYLQEPLLRSVSYFPLSLLFVHFWFSLKSSVHCSELSQRYPTLVTMDKRDSQYLSRSYLQTALVIAVCIIFALPISCRCQDIPELPDTDLPRPVRQGRTFRGSRPPPTREGRNRAQR